VALAIVTPPGGGQVGWGYAVDVSGATGPTALDDKLIVTVELGTGQVVAWGSTLFAGNTAAGCAVGAQAASFNIRKELVAQLAPGATVSIRGARYTHANALVEQVLVTGFVWDPTSGLGALLSEILSNVGGGGGSIADVLAAVRRTY
jgi:hypothetical protein